jgi:hypothetical protein
MNDTPVEPFLSNEDSLSESAESFESVEALFKTYDFGKWDALGDDIENKVRLYQSMHKEKRKVNIIKLIISTSMVSNVAILNIGRHYGHGIENALKVLQLQLRDVLYIIAVARKVEALKGHLWLISSKLIALMESLHLNF